MAKRTVSSTPARGEKAKKATIKKVADSFRDIPKQVFEKAGSPPDDPRVARCMARLEKLFSHSANEIHEALTEMLSAADFSKPMKKRSTK